MPGVSLGRGEATLGVHRGDFIELREGDVRDPRAGRDSAASARSNAAADCRVHAVEHDVGRHREAQSRPDWPAPAAAGVSPARIASITAQHATLGASGPTESRLGASGNTPVIGTRRAVGL